MALGTAARADGENGHENGQDREGLQGTELIATNEMSIITPNCIVCGVNVVKRPATFDESIEMLSRAVISSALSLDSSIRDRDTENNNSNGDKHENNAAEEEEREEARLAKQTFFWTRKWDVHARGFLSVDV